MSFWAQNKYVLLLSSLYIALCGYFIWNHQAVLSLASVGLLAVFAALYFTEEMFLLLGLLVPLSVNIEEWTDGFGLFLPTEPLLFGFLILIFYQQTRKPFVPTHVWKHPIVLALGLYLTWLFISSIASTHMTVSFKFLLVRLWFIVPMVLLGTVVFAKTKNIRIFLWLFITGMAVAGLFTVINHMQYSFGEKESHWVMWPFFKDHTIYGAIVAIAFVLSIGLYLSKKYNPLTQAGLLTIILVIGIALYFSYTRAAWLSVFAAAGIGVIIRLKIPFSYLLGTTLFIGTLLFISWDELQMELARNKSEHTTEDFGERLQSATNVTTDASNLERLNRWDCAWQMFQQEPVFGFGPGTYAMEYARFQHPDNLTIISTNFGDGGNAHSEYLGPLSETGFPGLITVLILVAVLFYKGITLYIAWPAEDSEYKTLIFYMVLALSTYFIHGFLNNYLDTDKAAVPIWGMAAMFIALEARLKQGKVPTN